jgi:hypothetical protein
LESFIDKTKGNTTLEMQDNETAEVASTEETISQATETTATEEIAQDTVGSSDNNVEAQTSQTNETGDETNVVAPEIPAEPEEEEEVTYHAVQKEDSVTAIWEMQGRKHIRTIDPRSREGAEILRLFTAEEGEEAA